MPEDLSFNLAELSTIGAVIALVGRHTSGISELRPKRLKADDAR